MEAREIKRLPEDLEAEQRYLEELKGTGAAQRSEDRASARARLLQLSGELDETSAGAEASLMQSAPVTQVSSPAESASAAESRATGTAEMTPANAATAANPASSRPHVEDSDEAAAEVLRSLNIEMAGSTPSYGVIYRMARWIDELMSSIFKRPTY